MKPPPRKRTKRVANFETEPEPHSKLFCNWQLAEQRKLLNGLKALIKKDGGKADLDYATLKNYLPTRSTTEIESVINELKDKIISSVCVKLENKRRDDNKFRKPIEKWTHMASVVGGALDEPITTAFSQMLIVSSTEPCTLRNCDPPQMDKPPTDQNSPLGRIVPFRPMHDFPAQGECPGISAVRPLPILRPPAPTMSPARRLPAPCQVATNTAPPPKQQSSEAAGNPPLASITSCQTSESASASTPGHTQTTSQHQTTTVCSAAATPVPSTSESSLYLPGAASSSVPTHTTTTFGPTGKHTTKNYPRALGVKSIVDFEKIYQYLSVIHNPDQGCKLTPMESAIVLDLLMSLPEELPLLDCKNLRKHLVQVYQSLSIPADSKMVKEVFKDLKRAGDAEPHTASSQDGPHAQSSRAPESNPQQEDHSWDTTDTGPKALQPQETDSQSSGNTNTHSQCEDEDLMGLCPPLNPFMVPPELLKKKSSAK